MTPAEERQWRDSLKPGDEVVIHRRIRNVSIGKVVRRTKTQIIVGNSSYEERYRASNGYRIGDSAWNYQRIAPVTDELHEDLRVQSLRYRISLIADKVRELPLPVVEAMLVAHDAEIARLKAAEALLDDAREALAVSQKPREEERLG